MVRSHPRTDAVTAPKGLARACGKEGDVHRLGRCIVHLQFHVTTTPHRDGGDAKPGVFDRTVQPFCSTKFGSTDGGADASVCFEKRPAHDTVLVLCRTVPRVGLNRVFCRFRRSGVCFQAPCTAWAIHAFLQHTERSVKIVAWNAVRDGEVVA